MSRHDDRYGLPVTTASRAALTAYLDGVDRILAADAGAPEALERAVAEDPGFALAQVAHARALQIAGQSAAAQAAARRASTLAPSSPRERSHVSALGAVVMGDAHALEAVRRHIAEFPRDALVLAPAVAVFGLIGFSGQSDRERTLLAWMRTLAPVYGDDWWFGAWYGFLHTENGLHDEGLRLVDRALAANPRNANAVHAMAHALYERAEADAGARLLAAWLPGYSRAAPLHCHLSWHRALAELEAGRPEAFWSLFDDAIRPAGSPLAPPINTLTDSASLLWRAELAGQVPPPGAWQEVHDFARDRFTPGALAFADVHAVMAFARTGDQALLEETRARVAAANRAGTIVPALVDALAALARQDWAGVIQRLAPMPDELVCVGGSGAQRDVFQYTLLSAYLRAGRGREAASWLAARPPRPRDPGVLARLERGAVSRCSGEPRRSGEPQ